MFYISFAIDSAECIVASLANSFGIFNQLVHIIGVLAVLTSPPLDMVDMDHLADLSRTSGIVTGSLYGLIALK